MKKKKLNHLLIIFKNISPLLVFVFFSFQTVSQVTTVLQPGAADGKDALIWSNSPDINRGTAVSNVVYAWTNGGQLGIKRSLIQFDLSEIPTDAVILEAKLSLFYNPDEADAGGTHSGENEAIIRRINSDWQEMTVTWNTQPATTTQNEIILPISESPTQDYVHIDVLGLVNDMMADPENSHGFMIKMRFEQFYKSIILASSDHEDVAFHPKLEITWNPLTSNEELLVEEDIKVFPNPSQGVFNIDIDKLKINQPKIEIVDITGRSISDVPVDYLDHQINIDLSNYSPGVYYLKIYSYKNIGLIKKLILSK